MLHSVQLHAVIPELNYKFKFFKVRLMFFVLQSVPVYYFVSVISEFVLIFGNSAFLRETVD